MNKKLLSFVLLLTLGLTSLFAVNNGKFKEKRDFDQFDKPAYKHNYKMNEDCPRDFPNCENLNLSDKQKKEVEKINDKYFAKRKELKKKMLDIEKESLDILSDDYKGIKALHNKKSNIRNQMFNLSIDEKEEISEILTEEQKDKFKERCNGRKFGF